MKILEIKKKILKYYDNKATKIIARQQLDQKYFRNGICYVIDRKTILNEKNLLGNKSVPYIMIDKVVNIDTIQDLELAKYHLSSQLKKKK